MTMSHDTDCFLSKDTDDESEDDSVPDDNVGNGRGPEQVMNVDSD